MSKIVGHISQVIGPVVDVYFKFEEGQDVEHALPKIHDAMTIARNDGRISGCEQPAYCGLSVVVHPVTACGVAANYIRLCALYLHILLTRILAGLKPFESLAWSHVEVCPLQ